MNDKSFHEPNESRGNIQFIGKCPCYKEDVAVVIHQTTKSVYLRRVSDKDDWKKAMSSEQISFVNELKSSGLFDAFVNAAQNRRTNTPKNMELFFLKIFSDFKPRTVPRKILDELRDEYPQQC